MSDLIVDLRGLLRRLREHDVDYVLFGALAMVFYGYVRNTEDLDIAIDLEPENLDRVTEWLQSITIKLNPSRRRRARGACRRDRTPPWSRRSVRLTSCNNFPVPEWPQLIAEAELYEIEGMRVRVMNRRTLIELKRLRGSNQDLADIEAIELLADL